MGSAFGWVIAIFAVVWLFLAGRGITGEIQRTQQTKWIMGLMGLLVLVGAGGFFAAGLSAVGVLKLPSSR
jgi:bacteriorhodopsin